MAVLIIVKFCILRKNTEGGLYHKIFRTETPSGFHFVKGFTDTTQLKYLRILRCTGIYINFK